MKNILFVDNNPEFANTRAEFLEVAGYRVFKAFSPGEAEEFLRERWVPLAILDVRLTDDNDEKDMSGVTLAKLACFRPITKIFLSGYPASDLIREVLRVQAGDQRLAVDFLGKGEGPEELVRTVEEAFAKHVHINWELDIGWRARDRFALVNLIEPELEGERLLYRAEELSDLFRRLFFEKEQIRIDRLVWQGAGRVALIVFAFAKGEAESLIVTCGRNAQLAEEAIRHRNFAPQAPGDLGTALIKSAETSHFAANAYALAGADLENATSLATLYRAAPEKSFNLALVTLLQKTLAAWGQKVPVPDEQRSLVEVYRELLGLDETRLPQGAFEERVQAIVDQSRTLTHLLGARIERDAGKMIFRFNDGSPSYPDPALALYRASGIEHRALLLRTSGTLSGDNILADNSGRAWLTDFADAGLAPLHWNFVTLEAVIRFDWSETLKLPWLHEMEQRLVVGEFGKLDTSYLESPLRKSVRTIRMIRQLASRTASKDPLQYHLGMLFHAASRIASFNPAFRLLPNELARLIHALMAAAMICDRIAQAPQTAVPPATPDEVGIRIDRRNQAVWVNGAPVSLSGQSYELLCYLHEHAGHLCRREEIVRQVFDREYDKKEPSHRSLLNTAIRRLREKIEDDPDHPRYLLTVPGGYRLATQPNQ